MTNAIDQWVVDVIARHANLPTNEIELNSNLRDDLGFDSLVLVEILFEVESFLGTTVHDEWFQECKTVGDVIAVLKRDYPSLLSNIENKERRRTRRKILAFPVLWSSEGNSCFTYSLDVSDRGIAVVSKIEGRRGAKTEIQFNCADTAFPITLSGEIVESRPIAQNNLNLYRMGIDLSKNDPTTTTKIADLIKALSTWDETAAMSDVLGSEGFGKSLVSFKKRVYLQETNLLGNVYFSNYFSWQGMAREEFMRELNMAQLFRAGVKIATLLASVKYFKETTLYDDIEIGVFLARADGSRVELLFKYNDFNTKELIAIGRQVVAFVGADGKAMTIPDGFRAAFLNRYIGLN